MFRNLYPLSSAARVALLSVFVVLIVSGVASAWVLTHPHNQLGDSDLSSPIPGSGTWQLKVDAPTFGWITGKFEFLYQLCGYARAERGTSVCGEPCAIVTDVWEFKTHAHIDQGTAKGVAWCNDPIDHGCPDPKPNAPGGE